MWDSKWSNTERQATGNEVSGFRIVVTGVLVHSVQSLSISDIEGLCKPVN